MCSVVAASVSKAGEADRPIHHYHINGHGVSGISAMVSIACSRLSVSVTFTSTVNRQAGFNCGRFPQQRYI
jgi:hypothetical protein